MERDDLSTSPASIAAMNTALDMAGLTLDDIAFLDFYSCFPIAVFNICDAFGLRADDPRGLTVTGGLPYFGGPGNNYSMHAIAEVVDRVRSRPGTFGLVAANGGLMSKYSVGIYATTPTPWQAGDDARIQRELDSDRPSTSDAMPTAPRPSRVSPCCPPTRMGAVSPSSSAGSATARASSPTAPRAMMNSSNC